MRTQSACALVLLIFLTLPACGGDANAPGDTGPPSTSNAVKPSPPQGANQQQAKLEPAASPAPDQIPVYTYEVVASYPHDAKAYTQGLVFHDGALYESTGQYDQSSLRKVELKKGKVKKKIDVPGDYFAEGMTILNGKIYQLTWLQHKCFIYDLKDFKLTGEFAYEGEGWGLTTDGHSLIMSDGTNQLRFIDPATFKVIKTVSVTDNNQPLTNLNELEYIRGEIYANIWKTDKIVRIDPTTGKINAWVDMTGLHHQGEEGNTENCLNGIAYDAEGGRLFVTGKRWPNLYEIRLVKR